MHHDGALVDNTNMRRRGGPAAQVSKRNFALIIMRRFWTTPSIVMLRCDPGLEPGEPRSTSFEARFAGTSG